MFRSHLISLILFSATVSILMAFIKYDEKRDITRYAIKYFLYMTGGVILFSWFMRFL